MPQVNKVLRRGFAPKLSSVPTKSACVFGICRSTVTSGRPRSQTSAEIGVRCARITDWEENDAFDSAINEAMKLFSLRQVCFWPK